MSRGITEDERALLAHVTRWGSDGYPITRRGRSWYIDSFRSVRGFPTSFKTKREATAQFEKFLDILIDATAGRI